MAVVGSKGAGADGVAEKLSCGSCGDCVAVAVDFLPVKTSQLMLRQRKTACVGDTGRTYTPIVTMVD